MSMDLFKELIPLLNSGNLEAINKLTDEQLKSVAPLIGLKVMSSVRGRNAEIAILSANDVNEGFFEMTDHPKLQLMMLSLCASRGLNYYPGNFKKDPLAEFIRGFYPHWKNDEIRMLIDISSKEELIQLGNDHAVQGKNLKKWNKAIKERKG